MSVLSVTIGGIPFNLQPQLLHEALDRFMPADDLPDVMQPRSDWPGPNLLGLGLPMPPPPAYPASLGCLWYPWGMSRFGIYRGIMSAANITLLGALVTAAPTDPQPFKMLINDTGTPAGVETDLYVLPPRPLVYPVGTSAFAVPQLYLVTLVDDRFFRQGRGGGTVRINSTDNATWASLITALATALGISLTSASVDAAYYRPEPDSFLYSNEESAAALLDATAANVGRVVVRNFDGTYKLQTYADANTATLNSRYQNNSSSQPFRSRLWGGNILPTDNSNTPWTPSTVPAEVIVTFPKWITGAGYYEPTNYREYAKASYGDVHEETVTLSDLGSPYSTWTAGPGKKIIRLPAKAEFVSAMSGTPSNATDVTTLAQRVAQDFYDAASAALDECYTGIVNRTPDGACDTLWCVRIDPEGKDTVYTRVTRVPFEYGASHRQNGINPLTIPSTASATIPMVHVLNIYEDDVLIGWQCEEVTLSSPGAWPPVPVDPQVIYDPVWESEDREPRLRDDPDDPVTHIIPLFTDADGNYVIVFWKTDDYVDVDLVDPDTTTWTVECIDGNPTIIPQSKTYRFALSVTPPGTAATGISIDVTNP